MCRAPPTTRVIQNLTEDREPTSPPGVKVEEKKAKDMRVTRYEGRYNNRSPATAPESLLGIYFSIMNKSASTRIPQSIPRVIESTRNVCALSSILVGPRSHQDRLKGREDS